MASVRFRYRYIVSSISAPPPVQVACGRATIPPTPEDQRAASELLRKAGVTDACFGNLLILLRGHAAHSYGTDGLTIDHDGQAAL